MINVESEIFTFVQSAVKEKYPDLYMTGEYVHAPSQFPCATLIEMDNVPLVRTQTTDSSENHASLMYEINVYSNKRSGRKTECRKIAAEMDNALTKLGFVRTMLNPIPNLEDATVYRITGRYRAVISIDKIIYRR